jgi:hypothetical protein
MNAAQQMDGCKRVYARLLRLYPAEYRSEFGEEMQRCFSDQCRAAQGNSWPFWVALWLRTVWDTLKNAIREHFTSPFSSRGLLEAEPGRPLPWKGVLLVLIPGVIVFIMQVGTLNGKDWFFTSVKWVGFACLAPALITWITTRKFPVWGLMPLGMAFYELRSIFERQVYQWSLSFVIPLRDWLQKGRNKITGDCFFGEVLILVIILVVMAWLALRKQKVERGLWVWAGLYGLLFAATVGVNAIQWQGGSYIPKDDVLQSLVWPLVNQGFYGAGFFWLVALLGAFLARRHGKRAILLLAGYLLPVMLYGSYLIYTDFTTAELSPDRINASVFIYRICLALLIPLWLARADSSKKQWAAVIAPVSLALIAQASLHIAQAIIFLPKDLWKYSALQTGMEGLLTAAGFALAFKLYRSTPPEPLEAVGKLPLAAPETS